MQSSLTTGQRRLVEVAAPHPVERKPLVARCCAVVILCRSMARLEGVHHASLSAPDRSALVVLVAAFRSAELPSPGVPPWFREAVRDFKTAAVQHQPARRPRARVVERQLRGLPVRGGTPWFDGGAWDSLVPVGAGLVTN
jgi:hypothetical protein